ncbi:MAG: methyltransferase domain-containing protein [Verrucomicrobiota bacterium]
MDFSIHSIYRVLFKVWRRRRFDLFLKRLKPASSENLLDVGGSPGFWTNQPQPVRRIDTLNVYEIPWNQSQAPEHDIRTLVGDGCCLTFADQSYDIGFSNSVIEHVGSWERQQQFAREIRRVAKKVWVQTPAYECFFEPHYMTPFVHYLPKSIQPRIVRWCTLWGWIERPSAAQILNMVETTRLLRKQEMMQLFPDCDILTERWFFLFPKSYIAIRTGDSSRKNRAG